MAMTENDVLDAFARAGRTLVSLRIGRLMPGGYRSCWPRIVADPVEARPDDDAPSPRTLPLPAEIDHLDVVLSWRGMVPADQYYALWGYGLRVPVRVVAERLRCDRRTVYRLRERGCAALCRQQAELVIPARRRLGYALPAPPARHAGWRSPWCG